MNDAPQQDYGLFDIGDGPMAPDPTIMETGKVDLAVYTSQQRFDEEREVFGRVWLNIARVEEIPNPGDWIVRDIAIRSASIIIVRGKDDKIRAFHNICSHRGMKLVWDRQGTGGRFSCPYHAWLYGADGELKAIPDQECFPYVDKTESGLTPVAADTWEGFIFVNLDPEPKQSLWDYLGPVTTQLVDVPFDGFPYKARVGAVIEANWKLGMEAQCEAYHVRALHARTVSAMLSSRENPFVHPLEFKTLGAHRSNSVPRNPDFTLSENKTVQNFAFCNTAQMVIADTGSADAERPSFTDQPGVNGTQSNLWGNEQFVLFPHFIFHLSLGGWWLHRFWPLAPNKTYWEAVYSFEQPLSLRQKFAIQSSLALNRDTLMEDNLALVQQQTVMESGAKRWVQFGEQEAMCKHLAAVCETVVNDMAATKIAAE